MWMWRFAWCLRSSERRGGEMQRFWNEPNTKGPSLRRASSSGSSLDILSAPRKGMLEEGWHFTQNPIFVQGEGQLSDCFHQSGGQLPERKVRKSVLLRVLLHRIDCSPGFITGADTHGLSACDFVSLKSLRYPDTVLWQICVSTNWGLYMKSQLDELNFAMWSERVPWCLTHFKTPDFQS